MVFHELIMFTNYAQTNVWFSPAYQKLTIGARDLLQCFWTEIKKREIGVRVYEDFFERNFIEELDELHSKISAKVQREDSKKVPFAFEENEKFTNLLNTVLATLNSARSTAWNT